MGSDETRMSRPPSPKGEMPAPTEAELSRIAREAVRQPADPRLDKQLERMGLADAPAVTPAAPALPAAPELAAAAAEVEVDPRIDGVERRLRRVESIAWLLVIAVVILAVAVVALLIR